MWNSPEFVPVRRKTPVADFLADPNKYLSTLPLALQNIIHNGQVYVLGLDNPKSPDDVAELVSEMAGIFPVVMIADHMDESLIQLRRTMCWSVLLALSPTWFLLDCLNCCIHPWSCLFCKQNDFPPLLLFLSPVPFSLSLSFFLLILCCPGCCTNIYMPTNACSTPRTQANGRYFAALHVRQRWPHKVV